MYDILQVKCPEHRQTERLWLKRERSWWLVDMMSDTVLIWAEQSRNDRLKRKWLWHGYRVCDPLQLTFSFLYDINVFRMVIPVSMSSQMSHLELPLTNADQFLFVQTNSHFYHVTVCVAWYRTAFSNGSNSRTSQYQKAWKLMCAIEASAHCLIAVAYGNSYINYDLLCNQQFCLSHVFRVWNEIWRRLKST